MSAPALRRRACGTASSISSTALTGRPRSAQAAHGSIKREGDNMPFIQLKISGERDAALAARAAERITAATQQILRKNPADTAIAVEFVAPELWFIANAPLAAQEARSFYLKNSI